MNTRLGGPQSTLQINKVEKHVPSKTNRPTDIHASRTLIGFCHIRDTALRPRRHEE